MSEMYESQELLTDESAEFEQLSGEPDTAAADEGEGYRDSVEQTAKDEVSDAPSEMTTTPEGRSQSASEDILELCLDFPEMRAADVCRATSSPRYAELRRIGLTPREAYLATSRGEAADNRSHLTTGVPSGARANTAGMTGWEMSMARAIFSDLPENEIKRLYTKVTSQHR